jgi:MOSC domain-containing protein YiiM
VRQDEPGKPLLNGAAGENPATAGIVANGALISEQRRVGRSVLPEVSRPLIPCGTFQGRLDEPVWIKRS